MKIFFNSLDITASVYELQRLVGMRVNQIYDCDTKTYLFKLARSEEKEVLLLDSGVRFHTTSFDWPKNTTPSGFTMKLRKHLKNKRIEKITRLGNDRIVDFQFGSGEAAYHIILELFNRGNIILTDCKLLIVMLLRPHTENDKFRFAVREQYPISRIREISKIPDVDQIKRILSQAHGDEKISKVLIPFIDYGVPLIEHLMLLAGLNRYAKCSDTLTDDELATLVENLGRGNEIIKEMRENNSQGYIITRRQTRKDQEDLLTYHEFHPYLFIQHDSEMNIEFPNFNAAVDEFFSKVESQKIELKVLQTEKEVQLKVDKVKSDQELRIEKLRYSQELDTEKAEVIMINNELVDIIIGTIRKAISMQLPWSDVEGFIKNLQRHNHPIGEAVHELKLDMNHVVLKLRDPYEDTASGDKFHLVEIDLGLSAYSNATNYYTHKKSAAAKENKTIESLEKAVKCAEKKAAQTLKDVKSIATINKGRKTFWFEKFFWFISSDNFLVIGGRDQSQNELIVKRYLGKGDVYVHADLHGASSIVIKNPSGNPIPPRTLNEAGNMAVCYSIGWEAKVICSAWWVYHHQVSKSAPTGEYLTTGSFMIRGQKNFLQPAQLAMGLSFLFRLEESHVFRHMDERRPKEIESILPASEETLSAPDIDVSQTKNFLFLEIQDSKETSDNLKQDEFSTNLSLPAEIGEALNSIKECGLSAQREVVASAEIPSKESDFHDIVSNNKAVHPHDERSLDEEPGLALKDLTESVTLKASDFDSDEDCMKNSRKILSTNIPYKRGQKSKLKKIKVKYKDQDEEEKLLRMSILQSAGSKKEQKKNRKNVDMKSLPVVRKPLQKAKKVEFKSDDEDEGTDQIFEVDMSALNFLTGQPHIEDELLFAVPVVAPYSCLLNYKYKVKLIPGNSKRGKCARTAVEHFIRQKDATALEKQLIRAVNDQILSRNFPGKVKLSIPSGKK